MCDHQENHMDPASDECGEVTNQYRVSTSFHLCVAYLRQMNPRGEQWYRHGC